MNVHISDTIKATVITRIAGEISMTEQQFDDILRKACNACMKEEVEYFFAKLKTLFRKIRPDVCPVFLY